MKQFFSGHFRLVYLPFLALMPAIAGYSNGSKPPQEFYEIKIYHLTTADQEKRVDAYLQQAYLPALHKAGISTVGIFKPLANDTAADKLIYVFIPLISMEQQISLPLKLEKDAEYTRSGAVYLNTAYNNPAYTRIESILLRAFRLAPKMKLPKLGGAPAERIFELRSYESPTEKLYINKVQMFNERLGFNAVFYADVINGSHLPNLMYMTSFENKATHDEKWKAFGNAPEWKKLSALPEYQHNVSKADIILMRAVDYSDIK
jgi:NIPSNAP